MITSKVEHYSSEQPARDAYFDYQTSGYNVVFFGPSDLIEDSADSTGIVFPNAPGKKWFSVIATKSKLKVSASEG